MLSLQTRDEPELLTTEIENLLMPLAEWKQALSQHLDRVRKWTEPYQQRRAAGTSHPVEDFLFVYYQYSSGQLQKWHPGMGVMLEPDSTTAGYFDSKYYRADSSKVFADTSLMSKKESDRLRWTANMLRQTAARKGNFSCLGLHEWAMVYRGSEVRHEKTTPLRLPQAEIDAIVESRPLTCTHFDAFRFFAIDARPLNQIQPTLESRPELEQPACIHANMDLYKWAFKSMPWVGSELLVECFALAMQAREIDMRASPYDLSGYGDYSPIRIETASGRSEYEQLQRQISQRAAPLRNKLIEKIEQVIERIDACS